MTIAFTGLSVRHERRIRCLFSNSVAGGAFNPALFTLVCTNARGVDPSITAALIVPNTPNGVELALGDDLVAGGTYTLTSAGVPALDASTSPSADEPFIFGDLVAPTVDVELPQDDLASLVYGVDLVHTGADFLEDASGDLATTSGAANVQEALKRRLVDEDGLPWDSTYGANAGDFVNGPGPSGEALRGALIRQALADDRVATAAVTLTEDPTTPGDYYLATAITLRGAPDGDGFTINVQPPGS